MLKQPQPTISTENGVAIYAAASPELSRIMTDIRLLSGQRNAAAFEETLSYTELKNGADKAIKHPKPTLKLALVQDPVQRVFEAWRYLANFQSFETEGILDRLTSQNMSYDPSFPEFASQYHAYLKSSPVLRNVLAPISRILGNKLDRFDEIYTEENLPDLRERLLASAGPGTFDMEEWSPREPRPILTEQTVRDLEQITKAEYKSLKDYFDFKTSALLQRSYRPGNVKLEALPVIEARSASPDPEIRLAALVSETPEITRAFVEHHRKIGIGKLFLFLDDPDDPVADELANDPFIELTRCTDDFWPDGKRPGSIEARQGICYTQTYNRFKTGWLACCDADELIYPHEKLADVLARTAPSQWVVRAKSSEAAWMEGDDIHATFGAKLFRWSVTPPHWPRVRKLLYPENTDLLQGNLAAHKHGKFIVRCGLNPKRLAVHKPIFAEEPSKATLGFDKRDRTVVYLVHHDARSFPNWRAKLERRLQPRHGFVAQTDLRKRQLKAYRKARDEGRLEELFRKIYVLNEEQIRLLACCEGVGRIGTSSVPK